MPHSTCWSRAVGKSASAMVFKMVTSIGFMVGSSLPTLGAAGDGGAVSLQGPGSKALHELTLESDVDEHSRNQRHDDRSKDQAVVGRVAVLEIEETNRNRALAVRREQQVRQGE